jgi:hypothetical protein
VHWLPSLQVAPSFDGWVQLPVAHWSRVHGTPSSAQLVPLGLAAFAGQVALVPLQVSAASHSTLAARHTAPELPAGWAHTPDPQTSRVHGFVSEVHAAPSARNASAGQEVVKPEHASAWSHSPAAARQTVPALPGR